MGVGKSSLLAKFANSAFNDGKNVLHIFFEDNVKEIQRKHICCWTGVPLTEMNEESAKDSTVKKIISDIKLRKNRLLLRRWPSDTITMTQIKNYVKKLRTEGLQIDMVVLDYVDCVLPEHETDNVHVDEGKVMRKFEAMCYELNLAGWVATQGNRCVFVDEKVDTNRGIINIGTVNVGDMVLTANGYKTITYVSPIQSQPTFKITLQSGKSITVSEKHMFPIIDGTLKSIQTGLKITDELLTKNNVIESIDRSLNVSDFDSDKIISIEFVGEKETIDISVDDTEMFFANDIYTHNSSIGSDVVTNDQMGGSIKKGQIGHIIITVAKTLAQKDGGQATMAITKSRISKDGLVFENCIFNNAKMEFSTEQSETFMGFENVKSDRHKQRAAELYQRRRQPAAQPNNENNQ